MTEELRHVSNKYFIYDLSDIKLMLLLTFELERRLKDILINIISPLAHICTCHIMHEVCLHYSAGMTNRARCQTCLNNSHNYTNMR